MRLKRRGSGRRAFFFSPAEFPIVAVVVVGIASHHRRPIKNQLFFAGGAVFYNDQDYQWNDDGGAALPGAPRGQFSKQAARGKFFAMLSKQRRGGARAGDGVEIIG